MRRRGGRGRIELDEEGRRGEGDKKGGSVKRGGESERVFLKVISPTFSEKK